MASRHRKKKENDPGRACEARAPPPRCQTFFVPRHVRVDRSSRGRTTATTTTTAATRSCSRSSTSADWSTACDAWSRTRLETVSFYRVEDVQSRVGCLEVERGHLDWYSPHLRALVVRVYCLSLSLRARRCFLLIEPAKNRGFPPPPLVKGTRPNERAQRNATRSRTRRTCTGRFTTEESSKRNRMVQSAFLLPLSLLVCLTS